MRWETSADADVWNVSLLNTRRMHGVVVVIVYGQKWLLPIFKSIGACVCMCLLFARTGFPKTIYKQIFTKFFLRNSKEKIQTSAELIN